MRIFDDFLVTVFYPRLRRRFRFLGRVETAPIAAT